MQVIIVDDNPADLKLMESLIGRTWECAPKAFRNAADALAWCRSNTVDLLIVDAASPVPDRLACIRRFREQAGNADIPVLTIIADHDSRRAALENGANDVLGAPLDEVECLTRLRGMLDLRRCRIALSEQAARLVERVAAATTPYLDREREMITRLSRAAEFRDPENGAHIQRLACYSRLIARNLGLPPSEQDLILRASPLHDVGKISISDEIQLKPGRLDPDEYEIMKTHTEKGYELLSGSASPLLDCAAQIARTHHEKFDGSGYPRGLAGEAIPLHGRIVAVADVFDALTTERPYKRAWDIEHALRFLEEGAGNHFDPACVQAFIAGIEEVLRIRARHPDKGPVIAQP